MAVPENLRMCPFKTKFICPFDVYEMGYVQIQRVNTKQPLKKIGWMDILDHSGSIFRIFASLHFGIARYQDIT
jgi:hypothetical protein